MLKIVNLSKNLQILIDIAEKDLIYSNKNRILETNLFKKIILVKSKIITKYSKLKKYLNLFKFKIFIKLIINTNFKAINYLIINIKKTFT